MLKTLYVSDLDGTLLSSNKTLSAFTINTVNALVDKGLLFSYATARSFVTARRVTSGLKSNLPVIVYNGSFIVNSSTGVNLRSGSFNKDQITEILDYLLLRRIYPIVYAFVDGVEKFSYVENKQSRGARWFNNTRLGDVRNNPLINESDLYAGEVFHLTCIDEPEILLPIYEKYRDSFECIYHEDIYSGEQWLEIQPIGTTKAHAILELKELLGCERIVCFGDGKNDISMFEIADEGYAVENADDGLKQIATAIIESNDCDGVAKWLISHRDSL